MQSFYYFCIRFLNKYTNMKVKNNRLEALRLIISSQQLVAKAATMGGNYIYVLPNDTMYKRVSTPSNIREMMQVPGFVSINFSGNMGVIKTRPGYASSIAWNIDNSDVPQIIGTIAGDDTIFIVIKEGIRHQEVVEALSDIVPNMR